MAELDGNKETYKLAYVIRDDGSYGGWRTELLAEELKGEIEAKFLLCNCCRGVLRDACIYKKDGKHEVACSLCIPKDVEKQNASMNRETIKEKKAHCPLKSKGCDWTNELSELLHHLEECELFPVACPLGCTDEKGEVSRVERRGVETHRICCPMRTVKCEYCSNSVKACGMNGHLEVCEDFLIPCPNKCSEEFRMERKDKSIHLSQECPLQETECPYSQYGCEVKVKRRKLEQHEKEDMHKHVEVSISNMQSKVVSLQKENEELRKKDLKFQTLLLPIISILGAKKIFEWKISGVKNKISQKEDAYYSDPFYVGLYKFQGYVQWVSNDNYVGLFICIMKGEWDDSLKWPIRYKSSTVLINQLDAANSFEIKVDITEEIFKKFLHCFNKPSTERNNGFGQPKFISYTDLLQEKYSKDNSVTFKISVELISSP